MLLMIDNYDSFTYNLVHYFDELGAQVQVARNDQLTLDQIAALQPSHIVISPGPGRPQDAGVSVEVIRRFSGNIPMLGVCLGHQCIAEALGGRTVHAGQIMHGKTSLVDHNHQGVFAGLKNPLRVTRYHSLVTDIEHLPKSLEITARTQPAARSGQPEIMGLKHKHWPLEGVQFHPESVLSEQGHQLLANFLTYSC
ncbi:aminodeoxychorismate/anthranilate synthase component II [Gilvimarinus agarilyticus]|uniref:anthranilate synthase component II n=1 Tax=unclassified Gilvimarinus TaxID=2642066 RepID=UPI001C099DCB|nr:MULTISPECIES: aminodeoxychorismate/anthranilate synthase component II [unclassified Gilvimarinus]MBU2887565.1 aminodeoxychorismate/anthranilate synthase component II [Gilvimarinus agarilyticus]MDO6572216.1 aminodeoxychorismate/anthranilate synthase component II [Gilvimarinus sp. 2_MG-2023]MDO6746778.1 aminodeoxychorismate/anthranilate synthase component II [Gilvimarinus sp. 1_MG-2023]